MESTDPQNPYQVYCYECNVSAPVGTRNCVHCGNRLSRSRFQPSALLTKPFEGLDEEGAPDDGAMRLGGIQPMTVVWILIFIGGSFYRLCQ